MKALFCTLLTTYMRVVALLEKLSFLPVLGMRFWIADVFFKSGLTKINDWDKTVALFTDEYRVPVISPEIAAYLSTGVELVAPVLVVVGLFARFGALAMLVMVGVIEFTYMHFDVHIVWALMLSLIVLQGPGKASLDFWLKRRFCKPCEIS